MVRDTRAIACRYYVEGRCKSGDACKFLHPVGAAPPQHPPQQRAAPPAPHRQRNSDIKCRNIQRAGVCEVRGCGFLHPPGKEPPPGPPPVSAAVRERERLEREQRERRERRDAYPPAGPPAAPAYWEAHHDEYIPRDSVRERVRDPRDRGYGEAQRRGCHEDTRRGPPAPGLPAELSQLTGSLTSLTGQAAKDMSKVLSGIAEVLAGRDSERAPPRFGREPQGYHENLPPSSAEHHGRGERRDPRDGYSHHYPPAHAGRDYHPTQHPPMREAYRRRETDPRDRLPAQQVRRDDPLLRGEARRSAKVCRFFGTAKGCKDGDACRFRHPIDRDPNFGGHAPSTLRAETTPRAEPTRRAEPTPRAEPTRRAEPTPRAVPFPLTQPAPLTQAAAHVPRRERPCRYWSRGGCQKGLACPFLHAASVEIPAPVAEAPPPVAAEANAMPPPAAIKIEPMVDPAHEDVYDENAWTDEALNPSTEFAGEL
eukprot:TRINITY_DN22309_c0_g1_i1.p1 TRINITY_DN22309_c0_g1~~TRINITY_DN22309_c0_g1_i1.p1  ORF type:complete len:481 (+),score=37.99 TRINITY_DN22309_c0_g1_i1:84-1526(+)